MRRGGGGGVERHARRTDFASIWQTGTEGITCTSGAVKATCGFRGCQTALIVIGRSSLEETRKPVTGEGYVKELRNAKRKSSEVNRGFCRY